MFVTALMFQIMIGNSGPLKPPRDSGIRIMSNQSLLDLQACTIRQMARDGTVVLVPVPNGVAIDYTRPNGTGKAQAARFSLHVRDLGQQREISAYYRHPFSRKSAWQHTKIIGKRCFPGELNGTNEAPQAEKKRKKLFGIF
ncbi:hypothetical protein [Sphingomonas mesophila]|uniref:hypothetical protein n=1 Tax=Sphingomonas mesophila TaxID=2303576 RepID=UPI000E57F22A|nr:hypothetical protein [Sphingomonas mesophila]